MRYPLGLVLDSARYLASRKLRGDKKIPVMLSLDPMGACTTTCSGAVEAERRRMLSGGQCLAAMKECNAPLVAICGGEPLEDPETALPTRDVLECGDSPSWATG